MNIGPDKFQVQIRVTNTGNTTAHNVSGTFSFDNNVNNQYIYRDPQENTTKYLGDIAPGATLDLFWLVNVNRTSSAYDKDRNYTVTVFGDNIGTPNVISGDLIVQKLISQNRNRVISITLSNNNPTLGDTFAVTVVSSTASATYNYVDLPLINYNPTIVQPLGVTITYGSSTTNNILINNPGTTNFVSVWIFRAISAGFTPLSALILDQSGNSYHYNTDVNSTTITFNVTPEADLAITKTVNNTAPVSGVDTVKFVLTVTNNGPNNATGVLVNDLLPGGLINIVSNPSQGSYNATSGIWTIGNLAVNQTVTLNITALVNQAGQIINIANVTGNEKDPNLLNNQAIVALNPTAPLADLTISKEVDRTTVHTNDPFTFTVTVFNAGPNTANNVTVTDFWPSGLALLSATPSQGLFNSGTFIWNVGTLISGASATLTLTAEGLQIGNFTNVVNVTANETDPHPGDNTANATINVHPHMDLAVTKTVDNPNPNVGQNVTFTVFVTNLGPQNATGVIVNDPLPLGLIYVSSNATQGSYNSTSGIWTIGNLAVNQTVALNITVTVNQTGQITNIAIGTGNEHDHHPENNQGVAVINGQPTADLNIIKESDKTVYNNGDNVIFDFVVKNDGPNDANNVTVSDLLPTGLNFVSVPSISQGSYNSGTGIWNIGFLANGATATMQIIAKAVQTGFITNIATVNASEFDPHLADNVAAVTVEVNPSADLAILKSFNQTTQFQNQLVTATLTVKNNGPDAATGVIMDDPLPAGLTYVSDDSGGSYNPLTGFWTIGNLAVNQTVTLNIIANVTGTGTLTNIAVVSGNEHDPVTVNNQAIATVNGAENADLAISKTVDDVTPHVGDTITYTVTLFNAGPNTTNATVSEVVNPVSGLIFVSATPSMGTYNSTANIWTIDNFTAGSLASLVLKYIVNATGEITNTVVANSTIPDLHPEDNTASTTVNGQPVADIAVNKTVNDTTPNVLDVILYTINVLNNGPNNATNVTVTDVLPSGINFDEFGPSSSSGVGTWSAVWNGINTVTIFISNIAPGGYLNVTFEALISTILGGQHVDNTAVKTAEDQFDNDTSNDGSTVGIDVNPAVDLVMSKTPENATWNYGTQHTFNIDVTNNGPNNATNVVIVDTLPVGLDFVSATNGGVWNSTARTVTWTISNIPAEGSSHNELVVSVSGHNTIVINNATVTATEHEINPGNNSDNATVNIPAQSGLYLTISSPTECTEISKTALITFKVGNRGPDAAENVVFTWTIPEGMEFVSLDKDSGNATYDPATRTITWNLGTVPVGDPYLWVTVRMVKAGNYVIRPTLSTTTYDPNLQSNIEFRDICADAPEVNAASKTIPMKPTGLPFGALIASILMVIGGIVVSKRK